MPPNLLNVVRARVASVFCCGNPQSSTDQQAAPFAAALGTISTIANIERTRGDGAVGAPSANRVGLNDYNKKDIVRQFHGCLTRSSSANGSSSRARETAKTLAALSLVDKSWRAACEDELAVAYVNRKVANFFDDNFDMPIELIHYIDSTIKNGSLRGQAALEIVTGALRRSVSEADLYNSFQLPENQRQSFPYAEILADVLDLSNVESTIMNTIIAKACNLFWRGPHAFALVKSDFSQLGYSSALLEKMLSLVERDLADASSRASHIALRNRNVMPRNQVWLRWPTLSEMTKVAVGIQAIEGQEAAQTALVKILDCIQRAPHKHRIVTIVGVVAYADAFLDRRAYIPFTGGVASHEGEHTVDFILANIKQCLSKEDFGKFMSQVTAESRISTEVKARAYTL